MSFAITEMTPDDIGAVAHCHIACRAEAYSHIVPADDLARRLDPSAVLASWREQFTATRTPIWVARDDTGSVVGFAHAGAPRLHFPDLPPLELYLLYVRQSAYGSGLANQLLLHAIGDAPAWLWTYKVNTRAQRFYSKRGFAITGAEKPSAASAAVTEVQMVRPATQAASVQHVQGDTP